MIDILPTPSNPIAEQTYTNASPVIAPKGTARLMDFPDAMKEIMLGHTISRHSWESNEEYCLMRNGILSIHTKGQFHSWLVSDGDMNGMDWVVLPL